MDLDEAHSEISKERQMMHGWFLDASDCENGISKVREVLKVSKGHQVQTEYLGKNVKKCESSNTQKMTENGPKWAKNGKNALQKI